MNKFPIDITNFRFGRLVAKEREVSGKNLKWICVCDCGAIKSVARPLLLSGNTKSCGCLNRELARLRRTSHGHTAGYKSSKTFEAWQNMRRRCSDPKNKRFVDYGARGITVCDRWENSFENFLADMGEAPKGYSLDRIDNSKGYCPENCKWSTASDQMKNRRNAFLITHEGKTQNLVDWAKETGIKADTIAARIKIYGWGIAEALTTLPQKRGS